jgi:pimeloyl-ACP methyl ester carboxylesterase
MRKAFIFILLAVPGCFKAQMTPAALERGYVLMLPGVENYAWTMAGTARGLRDAGIDRAININQWGDRPFGMFLNLKHYAENREKALQIADTLVHYRREYPAAPITLVGYSGGGGMAIFVAEVLPNDVMLDRIILLAPAISPGYDLSKALAQSRRGVVNYFSPSDDIMLGWGTRTYGTMDRVFCDAAGRVGFTTEDDRIVQFRWRQEWRELQNDGGHTGWAARAWARQVLAPQIDPSLIAVGSP